MINALLVLLLGFVHESGRIQKANCFETVSSLPAPSGYHYPVEDEVSDYWQFYRDEMGARHLARALISMPTG
jgi:hypothetical protein